MDEVDERALCGLFYRRGTADILDKLKELTLRRAETFADADEPGESARFIREHLALGEAQRKISGGR